MDSPFSGYTEILFLEMENFKRVDLISGACATCFNKSFLTCLKFQKTITLDSC